MTGPAALLEVDDLTVEFKTEEGWTRVVDGVSFRIDPGRTVGLVGESGSGKTVTSLALLGLLRGPNVRVGGSILLDGRQLVGLRERALSRLRGSEVAMIFQEPRRSLDPSFTVGEQIAEVFRRHRGDHRRGAWQAAVEMLEAVGIADAGERAHAYPHEFSGGMCQRVMLAIALACSPKLLIADEPTTALDATVQRDMLRLMRRLQDERGIGMLLITHDLGVVAMMCDAVNVMYAGEIVEQAGVDALFEAPAHPYTAGLLAALPENVRRGERLRAIPGTVPAPSAWPGGCRFAPRCEHAVAGRCDAQRVHLESTRSGVARCIRTGELALAGTLA